jgi:hypothetical protein
MGYVGTTPLSGDYRKLDDISSGFDASETEFTLQVGSANVTPPKETTLLISVGGILQEPITAYTVSGSTLTFTAAPATGADFFGVMLGDAMSIGTPANDTVTGAKIVDNAIDSEHYTDGSIDTVHLAADVITGAKIADDAIDSEHYTDGSIDNAHIADDAIDSEHYAAASIDFAHIQNVAANSVLGRNANSSGVLSEVALATTQILIGDGTGFTAAALSGDATMTNAGVVSLAAAQTDITSLGTQAADFKIGNSYGLVVGHTAQVSAGAVTAEVQVLGTGDADSEILIGRYSANTSGPILRFAKGRDAIGATTTALSSGDTVGTLKFNMSDATDNNYVPVAAEISVAIDGTPGQNDAPGRIVFSTTADGAQASTEALRIDSSQTATFVNAVGIGNTPAHTTSGYELFIGDTSVAQSYMQFINSGTGTANSDGLIIGADASYAYFVERENLPMAFYTNNTEHLRITAGGDIGIALSKKLAFDIAVGDTYIYQESADDLHIVVGGVAMMQFDQDIGATVISAAGSAPLDQALFSLRGAFTSGGGGTDAEYFLLGGTLNSASGDTRNVGIINIDSQINTQAVSETTTAVASLIVNEPNIAKGSGHTITTAASIYIVDAPTEGNTNNYAIYVASGQVRIAERLVIDGNNGVLFEDAGKWGISYGTQVAGWATIGDASVYNGVAIYPGSVLYTNFPADGTIQPEYQGAVGTPTYSFQDDPNTGMYQSQADYLDFAAGGVYGLNIRTDKVNIPLTKLDLNGARFQKTSTADVTSSSGTVAIGNAWGTAPTVKFVRSFRSESGYTFRLDQIVTYGSTCTIVTTWGASHSELTYSSATGALSVAVSTGTFAFEVLEFYS